MNETNMTSQRPGSDAVMAMVPGLIVVLLGIAFLLSSTGVLHTSIWQFWRLWPVFLILAGGMNMLRRQPSGFVWGLATAAYGVCFLLDNFGLLPFHAWKLWPIFVVALGVQWLLATTAGEAMGDPGCGRHGAHRHGARHFAFASDAAIGPGHPLQMMAIFSETHARVTSPDLVRGEAFSMFGMCKIDLRTMGIPDHPVTIDASSIFGAVEIYIPGTWDVMLRGVGLLGAYQDETLPPAAGRSTESRRGLLVVTGHCTFAAVTVKN